MKKFKGKRGQSTTEYLLLAAVLVGFIFIFGRTIKDKIVGVTNTLFGGIDSAVSDMTKSK